MLSRTVAHRCPPCGGERPHKNGPAENGTQRAKCAACQRTFSLSPPGTALRPGSSRTPGGGGLPGPPGHARHPAPLRGLLPDRHGPGWGKRDQPRRTLLRHHPGAFAPAGASLLRLLQKRGTPPRRHPSVRHHLQPQPPTAVSGQLITTRVPCGRDEGSNLSPGAHAEGKGCTSTATAHGARLGAGR